jgi:CheY-like chemotaxis protein
MCALRDFKNMTAMSGYAGSQRPRQAILGQLPRIYRADGSPIRVLLVDDEPALTNLVKMALHYEGWAVEIAHNGREALAKFERATPDVLVLDIMLPDMDGLRILQRIRESDVYTPTLFLTARDSVMDWSRDFAGCYAAPVSCHHRPPRRSRSAIFDSTPPVAKSAATARRYRCRRPSSNCCAS